MSSLSRVPGLAYLHVEEVSGFELVWWTGKDKRSAKNCDYLLLVARAFSALSAELSMPLLYLALQSHTNARLNMPLMSSQW